MREKHSFSMRVSLGKKTSGLSDVTQGGLDSCQVCELVGLYVLFQMNEKFPQFNFGLYRDDGLGYHEPIPGPTLEKHKKEIIELFHEHGLKIIIETGLKSVDFLDVTLDLTNATFRPFRKRNDEPLYVHKLSNHPTTVTKQIPNSINTRLSNISNNEDEFNRAKGDYQKALKDSGYTDELKFVQPKITKGKK